MQISEIKGKKEQNVPETRQFFLECAFDIGMRNIFILNWRWSLAKVQALARQLNP